MRNSHVLLHYKIVDFAHYKNFRLRPRNQDHTITCKALSLAVFQNPVALTVSRNEHSAQPKTGNRSLSKTEQDKSLFGGIGLHTQFTAVLGSHNALNCF